jgi:hypothetical protein
MYKKNKTLSSIVNIKLTAKLLNRVMLNGEINAKLYVIFHELKPSSIKILYNKI